MSQATSEQSVCPVCSHNEWDPLEEVIIGHVRGAVSPPYHKVMEGALTPEIIQVLKEYDEVHLPQELLENAEKERQEFIKILTSAGVIVREPEPIDFAKVCATPYWESRGGMAACPRDSLLVIGDEIIEAPMSWRSRHFEAMAYRPLLKAYFSQGAKWTAAPKPQLTDAAYDLDYQVPKKGEPMRYVLTEEEPLFDGADFMRFGKDILALRSNTANETGIRWLARHLGEDYTVHPITSRFNMPMHMDDHMMPLAPGRLLINPEYIDEDELPAFLKSWEILKAPPPDPLQNLSSFHFEAESIGFYWLNVNVLPLDHTHMVVEASQTSTIKALKNWGFEPIPCPFFHYAQLGGLFHCATIDIRRRSG